MNRREFLRTAITAAGGAAFGETSVIAKAGKKDSAKSETLKDRTAIVKVLQDTLETLKGQKIQEVHADLKQTGVVKKIAKDVGAATVSGSVGYALGHLVKPETNPEIPNPIRKMVKGGIATILGITGGVVEHTRQTKADNEGVFETEKPILAVIRKLTNQIDGIADAIITANTSITSPFYKINPGHTTVKQLQDTATKYWKEQYDKIVREMQNENPTANNKHK